MWEMDALRCKCPGCDGCYEWLSDGPGCRQNRAKSTKNRKPEDMRCFECEPYFVGAGSTGSASAAGTARREDDARIVQLNINMSTCLEEVRRTQLEITELRGEVRRLQTMMENWARWYNY